jgi:hypothetical protein
MTPRSRKQLVARTEDGTVPARVATGPTVCGNCVADPRRGELQSCHSPALVASCDGGSDSL